MPRGWNQRPMLAGPARAIGATVIALSLLRWPVTAMLVSPGWGSLASQWALILAVQTSAEAMFWIGVWLIGRESLRAALARVADRSPLRTILSP